MKPKEYMEVKYRTFKTSQIDNVAKFATEKSNYLINISCAWNYIVVWYWEDK